MVFLKLGQMNRVVTAFALVAAVFSGNAIAQSKGPIRIGVLAPSTGPLAGPGAEMIDGLKMFWEKNNYTSGGRKVELVIADTTCNPDQALTQARRLALQEKVNFLLFFQFFLHLTFYILTWLN